MSSPASLKLTSIFFEKGILIEGLLQNKPGPGLATEFGILPPSTVKGESRMGAAGTFILSNNIKEWVYHLNLGLELDRIKQEPTLAWGIILEYPVRRSFRQQRRERRLGSSGTV